MALVDIAASQEDNILNMDELQDLITDDLKYRDKQLLRLKDEILDLEDFSESVALSEFTLDDFRIELARYIEANRTQLEQAPLGLYAVVPTHPAYPKRWIPSPTLSRNAPSPACSPGVGVCY